MELNKYIWLAALPMLFITCQEDALVENHQGLEGKFVLKASVDKEGSFSRAQIKLEEQEDGSKYGAFQWDEGDKFRMYEIEVDEEWNESLGATHDFEISGYNNDSPSTSATFVSNSVPTDGSRFYAYYPLFETNADGETITITIDQNLEDNSLEAYKEYFNKNMLMLAEGTIRGSRTVLYFEHQCGLICVSYTNETSEDKSLKGISMNGDWGVSKTIKLAERWGKEVGVVDSDGYGITFEKPVTVAAGATEEFFILFMQPHGLMNGEPKNMSRLSIVYADESNSSAETKTTEEYSTGMPTFYKGEGYRLNVKHTAENELVWTKAPIVKGFKVNTPAELIAALNERKDSIALGADIVLEEPLGIKHDVTLDLAGFSISMQQDKLDVFADSEDALIVVHRGGHLTLNDISNGSGWIEPGINYPTSTIKMVGKDDVGTELAKLTINEARLAGYNVISGTQGKGNTEIVINGGDINGGWDVDTQTGKGATGIFHPQAGTLTINDGYILGCQSAIEMRAGDLIVNGGRIVYGTEWNTFHKPADSADGTSMRACVALGISQGNDDLPINVTINENAYIDARGDAYAVYETNLYNDNTDNVTINIEGAESRSLNINGHIYSENKRGFIGSHTAFNSLSALSYIAAGAKNVHIECRNDYSGPAACIPDSEEGNGAEVFVNLRNRNWTIESANADNNYFYVGKNNLLDLQNGTICVPENASGVSLIKANQATLNMMGMTINSYNVHYAVDVEDGKTRFLSGQVNVGEGCYAFNIKAASLERNEPMFDLMDGNRIIGNFKMEIGELPASSESLRAPIMYINDTYVDGDLYFIGDNITNKWLFYCVQYDKNSVDFSVESTGWNSVQNATDENLPTLPVYITDPNWIAVIEGAYDGDQEFVKTDDKYVDVNHLTNKEIIESITEIIFDTDFESNLGLDFSQIMELECIDRFKALATLNLRNTSITKLDLSKNTNLTDLTLYNNKIESLNLANCNQLSKLFIAKEAKLTALDLNGCSASLTELSLNLEALTDLDLSSCLSLEKLSIWGTEIDELILPETTTLYELEVYDAPLTSLNVNGCTGLEKMSFYSLTELTSFDVTNLDKLETVVFSYSGDNKYNFTSFKIEDCEKLNKVEVYPNIGESDFDFKDCPSLKTISIGGCRTLDISGCTNLTKLNCAAGSLTSLDVSSFTTLKELYCGNNALNDLILGDISSLNILSCSSNNLTELNVEKLSELTSLSCSNNQLSELGVESLPKLQELNCSNNQISILEFNQSANLKTLNCSFNRLTALNVANMTNLETLNYYGNEADFEVLNLSGLSFITKLGLDFNTHYDESVTYKIKELNVSNCPNLTEITFYEGIGLEVLDMSNISTYIKFGNVQKVKGIKKIRLDQWYFNTHKSSFINLVSGTQNNDINEEPYHYYGWDFPVFEYPNGYNY